MSSVFLTVSVRPSVCLPVCLSASPSETLVDQDHTGWKSWKLIARAISLSPSLFVAKRPFIYAQGNMGKFGGARKDRGKVTVDGLWELTNVLSKGTIPNSHNLLFPKIGVRNPHPKLPIAITSGIVKAIRTSNLAGTFTAGSIRTKPH